MNSNQKKSSAIILSLFLIVLLSFGCVSVVRDFSIKKLSSPKAPLKVGLYMDAKFRNSTIFILKIGEGLSNGTERALNEIFNEVVIIDTESDISKQDVKAIIYPEIVGVESPNAGGFWTMAEYWFICKWTVVDADGKILYANTIKGIGKDRSFAGATRLKKGVIRAVEDHYQKLMTDMLASKWWENVK